MCATPGRRSRRRPRGRRREPPGGEYRGSLRAVATCVPSAAVLRLLPQSGEILALPLDGLRTVRSGQPDLGACSACSRTSPSAQPFQRATLAALCCAQNYVAYRAEREGASGCLRADRGPWGRRRFRSLSRQRNIFTAGLTSRPSRSGSTMSSSTRLTSTPRPARNSSDACSVALGSRLAKPGRCRTSRAVRVAREPSTGPKYVALVSPDPPATAPTVGRGQHSSARNIAREHRPGDHPTETRVTPKRAGVRYFAAGAATQGQGLHVRTAAHDLRAAVSSLTSYSAGSELSAS
jgi:hypothetical protein